LCQYISTNLFCYCYVNHCLAISVQLMTEWVWSHAHEETDAVALCGSLAIALVLNKFNCELYGVHIKYITRVDLGAKATPFYMLATVASNSVNSS